MNGNEITQRTNPNEWLAGIEDLSAVSLEVAINRPLAELVEITLTAAAGTNEHTARAYQTAIGMFLAYVSEKEAGRIPVDWLPLAIPTQEPTTNGKTTKTVWEFRGYGAALRLVTPGQRDSFITWLAEQGNAPSTRALRRNAVNTFLRVCLREGVITKEQGQALGIKPYLQRQKRSIAPVGRRLTAGEVRKFRAIIGKKATTAAKRIRDQAIIDLMLYAGLRRSEVVSLTPANFEQDSGRWWIVLTDIGKGEKSRKLKIHDTLYKSLADWLGLVGHTMGQGDGSLFYNLTKGGNETGKGLNASVIGRIVTEYGHLAGLAPKEGKNGLSPHDLRRTCARNAYDNGANLLKVQSMLGHSDPKTTASYIGAYDHNGDTAVDYVRY